MKTTQNPWQRHPAFTLLLILDLLALLPHLFQLEMAIAAILVLLWSWALAWRLGKLPVPSPWSKVVLTLLVAVAVFSQKPGMLGLHNGSALLAVMLLMKSLEIRSTRDFHAAIAALLFLLLSLLFKQAQWWMALYALMVGFGILLLLNLLARDPDGVDTDTPFHTPKLLRHTALLWAGSIPIAAALFLFFPRLAQPLWGLPLDSSRASTGLSEQLNPGDLGELFLDDTPVFRASNFSPSMPDPASLYWRAMVMWRFDGSSWKRAWLPVEVQPADPKENAIRYTLVNEAYAGNWRVSLDRPANSDYHARFTLDGQWVSPQRWQPAGEHHLASTLDTNQPTAHAVALRWGLQLPPGGNPKTRIWAKEQLEKAGSSSAMVQNLLRYFRDEAFYYSLSPPPLGENPIDEFLFQTRTGYCEHYASAMAFIMRAAGIPARVVTGYQGGEYNPLGQYILVRKSDAHAWTEIWLKGQGWVRVDPTAAVAPERVQQAIQQQQQTLSQPSATRWIQQQLDWLAYRWNRWFLRYNHELQQNLLFGLSQWASQLSWHWLLLLLLWPAGYLAYRYLRQDPWLRSWHQLQTKLSRWPNPPPKNLGPEGLLKWLQQQAPQPALQAWLKEWLYSRYARKPSKAPGPPPVLQPIARKPRF